MSKNRNEHLKDISNNTIKARPMPLDIVVHTTKTLLLHRTDFKNDTAWWNFIVQALDEDIKESNMPDTVELAVSNFTFDEQYEEDEGT